MLTSGLPHVTCMHAYIHNTHIRICRPSLTHVSENIHEHELKKSAWLQWINGAFLPIQCCDRGTLGAAETGGSLQFPCGWDKTCFSRKEPE